MFWTRNDDEISVLVDPTERLLREAEELGVRSVGESWSRKLRMLRSRWSRLSIPAAPMPALQNLTENWVRRHGREGGIAFSMLLHSKGLTQNMLDDVRSYTRWLQSRYGGQVAFLTFLELARLLDGSLDGRRSEGGG